MLGTVFLTTKSIFEKRSFQFKLSARASA